MSEEETPPVVPEPAPVEEPIPEPVVEPEPVAPVPEAVPPVLEEPTPPAFEPEVIMTGLATTPENVEALTPTLPQDPVVVNEKEILPPPLKKVRTYYDLTEEERQVILAKDQLYIDYVKRLNPEDPDQVRWKKEFAIDRVNMKLEQELYTARQDINEFKEIFDFKKLPKEAKGKAAIRMVGLFIAIWSYLNMWLLVLLPDLGPFWSGMITIISSGATGIIFILLAGWEMNAETYAKNMNVRDTDLKSDVVAKTLKDVR